MSGVAEGRDEEALAGHAHARRRARGNRFPAKPPSRRAILSVVRAKYRNPAQRLRTTIDRLPERTRRAMLVGIDRNPIIVGAYTDSRSGGICPMLAAHRNGGRTDLASFAIAWDAFTDARRPRLATRRELRTLRSFLELSLVECPETQGSIADAAACIRAERAEVAERIAAAARAAPAQPAPEPEPDIRITRKLRRPWGARAQAKYLIVAAQERLAEERATELLGTSERDPTPERDPPAIPAGR